MIGRHWCWSSYFFPAPAVDLQCSISRITIGLDVAGPELRNTLKCSYSVRGVKYTLHALFTQCKDLIVAYMLRALYSNSNSEGLLCCWRTLPRSQLVTWPMDVAKQKQGTMKYFTSLVFIQLHSSFDWLPWLYSGTEQTPNIR